MVQDLQKIEDRIDKVVAAGMEISSEVGGVNVQTILQMMEVAKLLSVSKQAVPAHCRGEPGVCFAVAIQAAEWGLSPISVANQSYVVGDKLSYMSQLIHAVIERRAPLQKRLRAKYDGEGPERTCTISGIFKGETEPHEYTSPKIKDIKTKNSPLWVSDPDQQLFYYSSRNWGRRYASDILLGIYSKEELEEAGEMVDVTPPKPNIAQRLTAGEGKPGFAPANIDNALKPAVEPEPELPASLDRRTQKTETANAEPGQAERAETDSKPDEAAGAQKTDGQGVPGKPRKQRATKSAGVKPAEADAKGAEPEAGNPAEIAQEPAETPTAETASEPEVPAETVAADESDQEAPSSAYEDALEMLTKMESQIQNGEVDDLAAFKKTGRTNIDGLDGLTDDERDVLRGRFTTIVLTAQRDREAKGKRK